MSKKKDKECVEMIKKNYKDNILRFLDDTNPLQSTYFFIDGLFYQGGCFQGTFAEIKPHVHKKKLIHLLLRFDRQSQWFDYNKLFKELNSMFGDYIKIVRYYSGKKAARIVGFELKKKFPDWRLNWVAMYLLFCLLRLIDTRNWKYWAKYFELEKRERLINNWKDIIYIHYIRRMNLAKFSLNNYLKKVCDTHMAGEISKEKFLEHIDNYLKVIKDVLGSKRKYTDKDLAKLNVIPDDIYENSFYQTPCWNILNTIRGDKK